MPPSRAFRCARGTSRREWLIAGLSFASLWPVRRGEAADERPGSMAAAELERAARRGELCSAANATGVGLRGEYFAHAIGAGEPLLARTDGTIDFDPSFEWPAARAAQRPASARWSGWVKPPISGRYRFHADQPFARVVVARQLMAGEGAAPDAAIELAAGRFYPIGVEMTALDGMAGRLRLEWTAPHGARYLVPRALLFLPNDSVVASKP